MFSVRSKVAAAVAASAALLTTVGVVPAQAATPGYTLEYGTLANGQRVLERWNPCQVITYKVNLASVPRSYRNTALALTEQAVAKVAAATGMTFGYRGATTEVPHVGTNVLKQSAEVIIAWTTPSRTDFPLAGPTAGYGGQTSYTWQFQNAAGRQVDAAANVRGYVVLDTPQMLSQMRRGFGPGATQGNLILHELGHVIGLEHTRDSTQLMYPMLSAASPNGYGAGDRAGLARLGRHAGCISVPAWVAPDLK